MSAVLAVAGSCTGTEPKAESGGHATNTTSFASHVPPTAVPTPRTRQEPPTFKPAEYQDPRDCRVETTLSTSVEDNFSPARVFVGLFNDLSADLDSPLPGARRVFEGFTSNHGSGYLGGLGFDGYVAASLEYGSQGGAYDYAYIGRFDELGPFSPDLVLRNCPSVGYPGVETVMGMHDGAIHLWALDRGTLFDVNVTDSVSEALMRCGNCYDGYSAELNCGDCAQLIDASNELIAVFPWGTKLAVTTFDKATDNVNSSIVIESDGRVVDVPGQLWTLSSSLGLVRWDPHTGARLAEFAVTVPPSPRDSLETRGIFFESGSFWASTVGADGEVVRHDPSTFVELSRVSIPDLAAVFHGGGHIWYEARTNTADVTLGYVDPRTGEVTTKLTMHSFIGIDYSGDTHAYAPDLQVDASGFWFSITDSWQPETEPGGDTAVPSIAGLKRWARWPVYRWQFTS